VVFFFKIINVILFLFSVLCFLFYLSCQCLWIVHYWLPLFIIYNVSLCYFRSSFILVKWDKPFSTCMSPACWTVIVNKIHISKRSNNTQYSPFANFFKINSKAKQYNNKTNKTNKQSNTITKQQTNIQNKQTNKTKPRPGFPTLNVVVFCVQRFEVKSGCLFCWYWWNWWPSLFKLSFHKKQKRKQMQKQFCIHEILTSTVFVFSFLGSCHDNSTWL